MIYYNAKIFKTSDNILEKGFIKTKNNIIEDVNTIEKCDTKNEEIYDCTGLKIVPGFIDAHSHIGMWENGLNFEGADGNEETDPICSHLRAIDAVNPFDDAFLDALKVGITTVITGPGSANPVGGSFIAIKTFGKCIDEMIIKDPVGFKFALGENPKSVYNDKDEFPTTRMAVAASIREHLEKSKRYLNKMKMSKHDPSTEPDFDIKLEVMDPLFKGKCKAFFHCHRTDDIFTAIRISKEFKLNLVIIHATEGYLIKEFLKAINLISGPLVCDRLKPELKNHSIEGVVDLFNSGINLTICSDHPVVPSNYFLHMCANLIRCGLSKTDVLKLITQNAAQICGIFDKVGSIEKFKYANFVAFKKDDDIFSPYVLPQFVVIDGKIVYNN